MGQEATNPPAIKTFYYRFSGQLFFSAHISFYLHRSNISKTELKKKPKSNVFSHCTCTCTFVPSSVYIKAPFRLKTVSMKFDVLHIVMMHKVPIQFAPWWYSVIVYGFQFPGFRFIQITDLCKLKQFYRSTRRKLLLEGWNLCLVRYWSLWFDTIFKLFFQTGLNLFHLEYFTEKNLCWGKWWQVTKYFCS